MQENNTEILNISEYDEFGDTRNRKGLLEDGYSKHNKGTKERIRIYFTKLIREAQSLKDKEKNIKPSKIDKENKFKKRILKNISFEDKEYGNNTQIISKKQKKTKIPKKDKIRF